jgi:AraC family transcriptional regulator
MGEKGVLANSKAFFHTPSKFAKKALYHITNAGSYWCSDAYETKRNTFGEHLFLYVKKGKMKVHYRNQEFIATENMFIFLDCQKPHLYAALEDTEFEFLHFTGNSSEDYFELLFNRNGCVYSLDNNWNIKSCMNHILTMMEKNKVDEHAASIIVQKILCELNEISNQATQSVEEIVQKAILYIENHYSEDINLDDIAKHVQLSPYHFSRVFKKHMNASPYQYLINYRINNAKNLLYNTNLSVKEIAFTCGFNSVSYFVTTFKKHSDLSPRRFRELQF